MKDRTAWTLPRSASRRAYGGVLYILTCLPIVVVTVGAHAQEEPAPPAEPAAPPAEPESAPAPAAEPQVAVPEGAPAPAAEPPVAKPEVAPAPVAVPPAAEPEVAPAPAAEPPPDAVEEPTEEAATEDEFEPSFTVGVGVRTGLALGLSGPVEEQLSLNDGLVDQVHARPYMAGSLTPNAGFFFQLEIGTPGVLGVSILDAIGQIKFIDELQLWIGQHIPANDRNNMNGPFFGNTWNFAIAVEEYPFDAGARDRGATLWGLIAGGMLKYHLSVVDLQPEREIGKARFAGRVTLHLLEPENFYYNSGTYFGKQDILALGAVFQTQSGEDGTDSDFTGFSFDAMFEKNFGSGGTLTAELGYWNYEETGSGYMVNQGSADVGMGIAGPYPGSAFMGVLSWLTPDKLGVGQLQPNARIQWADWSTEERMVIDVGLAYVVDGFNHKYHLNYRHTETDPAGPTESESADMIQVGVQYLMSN